jgi:hypothetical protein
VDQQKADAYATSITEQLEAAVARGDAETANAIVDQVHAAGHHAFARLLNTALSLTSLAEREEDDSEPEPLPTVEAYAIWLAATGIDESANNDLNEGGDPITERGGKISEQDWYEGVDLARDIAQWVRDNPHDLLALVRGTATVVAATR